MAATINVPVDQTLKNEVTGNTCASWSHRRGRDSYLFASVSPGRRSPVSHAGMIEADEQVREFLATRQGLALFKTPKEAFEALDRL